MASCGMAMDPHSASTIWYMFFQEWQALSKTDISNLTDMISLIQSGCYAGPPENKVLFTRQQATTMDTSKEQLVAVFGTVWRVYSIKSMKYSRV